MTAEAIEGHRDRMEQRQVLESLSGLLLALFDLERGGVTETVPRPVGGRRMWLAACRSQGSTPPVR